MLNGSSNMRETMSWEVTTFYQFHPIEPSEVDDLTTGLTQLGQTTSLCGLIVLGAEGINGTVAAQGDDLTRCKKLLQSHNAFREMLFKDSQSEKQPFRRFSVSNREQILTLKSCDQIPTGENGHLSPEEWHAILQSDEEVLLLDMRNWYETELGAFRGAVDPKRSNFGELVEWCQNLDVDKDQKVLMYCTGGIRCEKASLAIAESGVLAGLSIARRHPELSRTVSKRRVRR